MLQEKTIKTQRALYTFKELLSGRKVKNTSATQEIAQYWPEIEAFLKDSKVVFEFEGYYKNNSGPYDFITRVGNRIKKVFDTENVILSTGYHQKKKQDYPDYWFIEKDGSLRSDYEQHKPFEIVCPYTPIKDAHEVLDKFKKGVYNWYYGITDSTTGGHINITCPHDRLDFIKLVILANDHLWLKTFNREFNQFCESQYKHINEQITLLPNGLTFDEIISNVRVKLEKYTAFNFIKNDPPTIEFRVPGDDYLRSKFDAYKDSLDWFVFMIAVGMNKQMFRQEYMSKIMRIYEKSRKTEEQQKKNWIGSLITVLALHGPSLEHVIPYIFNAVLEHPVTSIPEYFETAISSVGYDILAGMKRLQQISEDNYYYEYYMQPLNEACNKIEFIIHMRDVLGREIPIADIKEIVLQSITEDEYEGTYQAAYRKCMKFFRVFYKVNNKVRIDWRKSITPP